MTDDEIHSAIVRWLAGIIGKQVIKDHQSGPRPALPCVMVNLLGTSEVREHAQTIEYQDGVVSGSDPAPVTATPVIETEWHFSVHAYGDKPTGILRPVRSAIQLAQKIEPLMPSLVVFDVSRVRNVPEWINERWEPRAKMDLFVRGLTRDGFVIDVIEEAPVTISSIPTP